MVPSEQMAARRTSSAASRSAPCEEVQRGLSLVANLCSSVRRMCGQSRAGPARIASTGALESTVETAPFNMDEAAIGEAAMGRAMAARAAMGEAAMGEAAMDEAARDGAAMDELWQRWPP